ncbi:MAG: ligase-associated DNA damage response endonuclease PdeM [Acidobacteriota bacterium]|nr:ligase-associated DNA damage response endonuclease PdeM [Acidobacteriota bacterium]
MRDLEIEVAGQTLRLLAERAIFWKSRETLLIADTHWGKAATLRAAAIPVPGGTTADDLARFTRLIDRTGAGRIVILGDAIHARQGRAEKTLAALASWRSRHRDLDILVVRGNHDRGAGDPPPELNIRCVDAPQMEPPFVFRHFPAQSAEGYTLAGHMHPAVKLYGAGRQRVTLPCFYFTPETGILPAFGALTGQAIVKPGPRDRIFAVAGDEVVPVSES